MGNKERLSGKVMNAVIGSERKGAEKRMLLYGGTGLLGILNLIPAAPVVAIGSFLFFVGSVYRNQVGIAQAEAEKIKIRNQQTLKV